ncbi:MAG TPA: NAD(P)H-dependent oxidoreductase [Acidobacteriaceae bacterium]
MATLLHLDSSPLDGSVSRELGREFVKTWKAKHPEGKVIYRDLALLAPGPVGAAWIGAAYTPEAARTDEQKAALAVSDELLAELTQADEYVIGVAMHNFSIPSVLKLWVDQVSRVGKTFSYDEYGPKGLLLNKKATLLVATGGVYEPGTPLGALNFAEPYLRAVLGFFGVSETTTVTAAGTAVLRSPATDRAQFLEPLIEQARAAVA